MKKSPTCIVSGPSFTFIYLLFVVLENDISYLLFTSKNMTVDPSKIGILDTWPSPNPFKSAPIEANPKSQPQPIYPHVTGPPPKKSILHSEAVPFFYFFSGVLLRGTISRNNSLTFSDDFLVHSGH